MRIVQNYTHIFKLAINYDLKINPILDEEYCKFTKENKELY